jgi:hypothetical protein
MGHWFEYAIMEYWHRRGCCFEYWYLAWRLWTKQVSRDNDVHINEREYTQAWSVDLQNSLEEARCVLVDYWSMTGTMWWWTGLLVEIAYSKGLTSWYEVGGHHWYTVMMECLASPCASHRIHLRQRENQKFWGAFKSVEHRRPPDTRRNDNLWLKGTFMVKDLKDPDSFLVHVGSI